MIDLNRIFGKISNKWQKSRFVECRFATQNFSYNGAIKIKQFQATDLDDFSNDTDIKCRITQWLMLLLTLCVYVWLLVSLSFPLCVPSLHVYWVCVLCGFCVWAMLYSTLFESTVLCCVLWYGSFFDSFSARAHTFLYTPYTTCYRFSMCARENVMWANWRTESLNLLLWLFRCSLHSLIFAEIVRCVARRSCYSGC